MWADDGQRTPHRIGRLITFDENDQQIDDANGGGLVGDLHPDRALVANLVLDDKSA